MKQLNNTFLKSLMRGKSKLILLLLGIGTIGLLSFSNGIFEDPFAKFFTGNSDTEIALTESEIEAEYKFYVENNDKEIVDEMLSNNLCPAGVRVFPNIDPGPGPKYPFHRTSGITVQSFFGNCIQGLTPCRFIGHITISTLLNQSGDYRLITPNGIIDLPNVNGSVNVPFGTAQDPLEVSCSFYENIILQAKHPVTGVWHFVRRFNFICLPCCTGPIQN